MLTKWCRQLSAEGNLPNWITGTLREIVIFEMMRSYFHHPFNRYAWVLGHDRWGSKMNYYSDVVKKLGLITSMMAKFAMNAGRRTFFSKNGDVLAQAVLDMAEAMNLEMIEKWVTMSEEEARGRLERHLGKYISRVRAECRRMEEAARLRAEVEARRQPLFKSEKFTKSGDSDFKGNNTEMESNKDILYIL
jgi:hypothetical protein